MLVAVCSLPFTLVGCGGLLGAGDKATANTGKGDEVTIGLLLPETATSRYEKFDHPIIKKEVAGLTGGKGVFLYANAKENAATQSRQLARMVEQRADTVIVDAVDARKIEPAVVKAKEAGVHVIAYDRLAQGPVDGYITFDGELVGQVQGQAMLEALNKNPEGGRKIVMMNGAPTDPNAAVFKRGALSQLRNNVDIAKSYDTTGWKAEIARANMTAAINAVGKDAIAGVYSANDTMAGAVIEALKAAGVTELPPVTGQDAELPAVRRIVSGEQYMSVYKPYPEEAARAAEMAVRIAQGRMIEYDGLASDKSDSPGHKDIPTHLVQVNALTRKTIKSTVIEDGIYKVGDICTAKYAADCEEIGLTR
nr:substrate-binding domain-containing protein [Streptomyces tsukubensis]